VRRSRRIVASLAATAGVLGGAGVAVAAVESTQETAVAPDAAVTQPDASGSADIDDAAREALQGYLAAMTARETSLEREVASVRHRIAHVRAVRAARLAAARAAAEARRRAAQQAAQAATARTASAPATHTSTGASGSTVGEHDDDEHEREGHHDD
jgi:septal ring factor EnvC (AmiA/AmiB activator)